jgi:tripartite-type tricarboxylate transporter receptor subunit TctC
MKWWMHVGVMLIAWMSGLAQLAQAQNPVAAWPSNPVRILIGYPPGSGQDFTARLVAERLRAKTGQAFVVEHRPGASGHIATEFVYKAPPDGYTLLVVPPAFATTPFMFSSLPFDPQAMMPITIMATQYSVLLVNSERLPTVRTLQELIAYAKANPGKLNYGSSGNGGSQHLAIEMLRMRAGNLHMTHVPYKGVAVMTGLVGGEVDLTLFTLATAMPHIRSGKIRALAVGSERRDPLLPDVPALAETFPGMTSATWFALLAPPRTAPELVARINAEWVEALRDPEAVKRLADITVHVVANSPADAAGFLAEERKRWGEVIRAANIRAD